jgi:hypothetical protein
LEALLLHDQDGTSELAFRLRTRAAWLIGTDAEARRKTSHLLNKLYGLRSSAVHRGYVAETPDNAQLLDRGIQECAALIRAVIERRDVIEWESLVLGA